MKVNKNILIILIVAFTVACVLGYIISKIRKMKYPVNGKITSKYGYRVHPVTGKKKLHNGVDIAVPIGTEVKPSESGKVSTTYYNDAGGNQMTVLLDNGYKMGFAHLSAFKLKPGDKFKAGETVALSGNTGGSTGPHLHLTLRDKKGNLIDPQTVFEA